MCTEVLSQLLLLHEHEAKVHVLLVGHGFLAISHIMFILNLMLFFNIFPSYVEELKNYLNIYESRSGQRISEDKSFIFGSRNASDERLELR